MAELILGPLLRHVTETTATFWVETDAPCTVAVLGHEARTFHVAGHHYALVVVRGLHPGDCHEYDVRLDGAVRWPDPSLGVPPSSVRTVRAREASDQPLRILFGSCRTAAPHEPPWTLQLALDPAGRGIDAYHAHARRLAGLPVEQWPDLMVWLGDQVYADDSSPKARERIVARREAFARGGDEELVEARATEGACGHLPGGNLHDLLELAFRRVALHGAAVG